MTRRVRPTKKLVVLRAIQRINDKESKTHRRATANEIAFEASYEDPSILKPVKRRGNGAVKGSWSGKQPPCQRILGSLVVLRKDGLIELDQSLSFAPQYRITKAGREALKQES